MDESNYITFSFTMSEEMKEQLELITELTGQSLDTLVHEALEQYFAHVKRLDGNGSPPQK